MTEKKRGSSTLAGALAGAAVIAGIVAVLWLASGGTKSETPAPAPSVATPAPLATNPLPPPQDDHASDPAVDAIPRITIEELQNEMTSGEVVVIDVRNADDYLRGHIPGSLQIPLSYIAGEVDYLPKNKRIVTYCT